MDKGVRSNYFSISDWRENLLDPRNSSLKYFPNLFTHENRNSSFSLHLSLKVDTTKAQQKWIGNSTRRTLVTSELRLQESRKLKKLQNKRDGLHKMTSRSFWCLLYIDLPTGNVRGTYTTTVLFKNRNGTL